MVKGGSISLALLASVAAAPALADCRAVLPPAASAPGPLRDVTAQDLIEMRNVGAPDGSNSNAPSPLALSPDGRQVAFVISRANLAGNDYCRAVVVVDLGVPGSARAVDTGGDLIIERLAVRGAALSDGWPLTITPSWSPDGRWIGYLRRDRGVTQVWRARADGSGALPVSRSAVDVESWAWADDGQSILFASRPGLIAETAAVAREGERGFLYDDRMWPGTSPLPMPSADLAVQTFLARGDGTVEPLAANDPRALPGQQGPGRPPEPVARDAAGRRAFTALEAPSPAGPRRIRIANADGTISTCRFDTCSDGIAALWWRGGALLFLRHQGWEHEATALLRWRPGGGAPKALFVTNDELIGCQLAQQLVCTRENATTPRKVVAIDPLSGKQQVIFDPNPEFARIRLGRVERLHYRNGLGLPSWADLVVPPGYKPGTKLPMVVTQYSSQGFLRGATGDEFPVFLFAARGYAVLSLQRPPHISSLYPRLTTWDALNAIGMKDWGERRSLLSSVFVGIDQAVGRGVADPARVGITGLSDGSTTVQFALASGHAFAAAAIGSCCMEPNTVMSLGTAWADWNHKVMGYPLASKPDPAFWKPLSLSLNAAKIDAPLLMQLADREYLQGLEAFTALREQRKPVEMYVFPDEYHTRVQPVHRLASYQRDLDWFDFWLRGIEAPDPAKRVQYARWRALRDARAGPH
jgi:dipeptidyl aminopeptidase/acylaminoacyl peptidase